MSPDEYLWGISTPEGAWDRIADQVNNTLEVFAVVTSPKYKEKHTDWETTLIDQKVQVVGYLCYLTYRMERIGYPGVAAKIKEILDLVLPADLAEPEARRAIQQKHREVNPRHR